MQFRSKPVVIDAMNWDGSASALDALRSFVGESLDCPSGPNPYDGTLVIKTLEGNMRASKGDWIIKGTRGEFYPCKPDVFATKYEPVNLGRPFGSGNI